MQLYKRMLKKRKRNPICHLLIAANILFYMGIFYINTGTLGIIKYILFIWAVMEGILALTEYFNIKHPYKKLTRVIKCLIRLEILSYICIVFIIISYLYKFFETNRKMDRRNIASDCTETVLIFGTQLENNQMTSLLINRLDTFLSYAHSFDWQKTIVIVTGGLGRNGKQDVAEADLMYNYLVENGFPPENIIKEKSSISTYENILLTKEFWENTSVVVISSDYHLPRIKCILDGVGCSRYSFIGAKTDELLLPYYMFEEAFGIVAWKVGIF